MRWVCAASNRSCRQTCARTVSSAAHQPDAMTPDGRTPRARRVPQPDRPALAQETISPCPPRPGAAAPRHVARRPPQEHRPGDPAQHTVVMLDSTGRQIPLTQPAANQLLFCPGCYATAASTWGLQCRIQQRSENTIPRTQAPGSMPGHGTMTASPLEMDRCVCCWRRSSTHHMSACRRRHECKAMQNLTADG
jgi:hypothetical protein